MKTSRPFSTISYNTVDFLNAKLSDLVNKRMISFYAFVEHYAEEDEKKAHKHLYIMPNGQLQTDQITDLLQEMDPQNPLKPLGVMPFQSSKWSDWYLYCIHDTAYLASKGQSRKHHYNETDFYSSDSDFLHELIHTIDRAKYFKTQEFVNKIQQGVSLYDLVTTGNIPAPQFNQWQNMYSFIKHGITERNGRETHTPKDRIIKVDSETGTIIE